MQHIVDGAALEHRLDGLAGEDGIGLRAGAAGGDVILLEVGGVGQEDVGEAGARRHVVVDHHDHLAGLVVLQDLGCACVRRSAG